MQNILSERSVKLYAELRAFPDGTAPIRYSPEVSAFRKSAVGKLGNLLDKHFVTTFYVCALVSAASFGMLCWDSASFTSLEGGAFTSVAHLLEIAPELTATLGANGAIGAIFASYHRGNQGVNVREELFNSIAHDLSSQNYEIIQSSREKFSYSTPQGTFLLAADDQGAPTMLLNGTRFQRSYESISAHEPELLTSMDGKMLSVTGTTVFN